MYSIQTGVSAYTPFKSKQSPKDLSEGRFRIKVGSVKDNSFISAIKSRQQHLASFISPVKLTKASPAANISKSNNFIEEDSKKEDPKSIQFIKSSFKRTELSLKSRSLETEENQLSFTFTRQNSNNKRTLVASNLDSVKNTASKVLQRQPTCGQISTSINKSPKVKQTKHHLVSASTKNFPALELISPRSFGNFVVQKPVQLIKSLIRLPSTTNHQQTYYTTELISHLKLRSVEGSGFPAESRHFKHMKECYTTAAKTSKTSFEPDEIPIRLNKASKV